MKWFRSNIRQGARLALLALSIQFVLSFGHFHAIAPAQATTTSSSLAASPTVHVENGSRDAPRPDQDSDHAADLCAICAVVAMANTAMPAAPPPLQLPDAADVLDWRIDQNASVADTRRVHFQPRAPPIL